MRLTPHCGRLDILEIRKSDEKFEAADRHRIGLRFDHHSPIEGDTVARARRRQHQPRCSTTIVGSPQEAPDDQQRGERESQRVRGRPASRRSREALNLNASSPDWCNSLRCVEPVTVLDPRDADSCRLAEDSNRSAGSVTPPIGLPPLRRKNQSQAPQRSPFLSRSSPLRLPRAKGAAFHAAPRYP